MALTEGSDYLFFPTVDISKQSLAGAMTRGCAVLTPDTIYVVPGQTAGTVVVANLVKKYSFGNESAEIATRQVLDDPELDLSGLDAVMHEMLDGDKTRWIFPLDDLEKFSMKTGFLGSTTLKMPNEGVRRLVLRGKGGKQKAKDFYAARLGG